MTKLPIPLAIEDFTAAWLTDALRAGGTLEGEAVTAVEAASLGKWGGFLGSLQRLSVTYDRPRADAPETIIAKFPALTEMNREIARQYQVYVREARFFRKIAGAVTAMPTPRAYYADHDPETNDGVVLLEDLATKLRIGDQMASPSQAEAEQLMTQSADLHATWWAQTESDAMDWVPKFDGPIWGMELESMRGFWPVYQQDFGHLLTPALRTIIERIWEGLPWLLEQLAAAPVTLVHGDYRLDNMFFPAVEGDPVMVIDWQLMSRGRGPYDIAYFTSQSLDVEQRRGTERELLRRYHERLVARGVRDYSSTTASRTTAWPRSGAWSTRS